MTESKKTESVSKKSTSKRVNKTAAVTEADESISGDYFEVAVLARDDGDPYGCGKCAPAWLQCFRKQPAALLAVMCILAIATSFIQFGVVPVSGTQWQRRFHFNDIELAKIRCMFDVGTFIMVIPVLYFGEKGVHRPQWIAIGGVVVGIGALLMVMTQFVAEPYHLLDTEKDLCGIKKEVHPTRCNESWNLYQVMLMAGEFLIGMGAMPNYVMSVTFLDENLASHESSVFTFYLELCEVLGPVFGFLVTGMTVRIVGDVDKDNRQKLSSQTYEHHNWYGAWWIAMAIGAFLSLIGAALMFPFPSELSGAAVAHIRDVREAMMMDSSHGDVEPMDRRVERGLWTRLKAVVTNRVFVTSMIERSCRVFMISGFSMFLVNYVEAMFEVTSSNASVSLGLVVSAAVLGLAFGAILQHQLRLNILGNLRLCLVAAFAVMIMIPAFLIRCPSANIAGVTTAYPSNVAGGGPRKGGTYNLEVECNNRDKCDCQTEDYVPVCFTPTAWDDKTKKSPSNLSRLNYFSRCLTGCRNDTPDDQPTNCSCLPGEGTLKNGRCRPCGPYSMYAFLVAFCWMILLVYVRVNPAQHVMLRAVHFEDRSIAMALTTAFVRLITIPSPFVFAGILNMSCRTRLKTECSDRKMEREQSCAWYDREKLGNYMIFTSTVLGCVTLTALFIAWILYKNPAKAQDDPKAERSEKPSSKKATVNVTEVSKSEKASPEKSKDPKLSKATVKVSVQPKTGKVSSENVKDPKSAGKVPKSASTVKHSPYVKLG